MAKLVSILDQVVASTYGHTIEFKAGEETHVADIPGLIKDCLAAGCLPAEKVNPAILAAAKAAAEGTAEQDAKIDDAATKAAAANKAAAKAAAKADKQ